MRYLGGKSRIAKQIAAVVAPKGPWWEPFCGGLSVSVELAKFGPGLISDRHPALISLYRAVRAGWQPPETLTREEYEAAKALPDSDPRKAFAGFGCSFGAKWFRGFEPPGRTTTRRCGRVENRDCAKACQASLVATAGALAACQIEQGDFLLVEPSPGPETIYCDPPYEGTTGYVFDFDHDSFWRRCQQWAAFGVRVFVSEYVCPVRCECVWEQRHRCTVAGGSRAGLEWRTERLFRVLP